MLGNTRGLKTPGLMSTVRTEPGHVRSLAAVGDWSRWLLLFKQLAGSSCGVRRTDSAQAPPSPRPGWEPSCCTTSCSLSRETRTFGTHPHLL